MQFYYFRVCELRYQSDIVYDGAFWRFVDDVFVTGRREPGGILTFMNCHPSSTNRDGRDSTESFENLSANMWAWSSPAMCGVKPGRHRGGGSRLCPIKCSSSTEIFVSAAARKPGYNASQVLLRCLSRCCSVRFYSSLSLWSQFFIVFPLVVPPLISCLSTARQA